MSEEDPNKGLRLGSFPKPEIGDRYREIYSDRSIFEVRGFVDDRIVLRNWWPRKQRYHYSCERVGWWPDLRMIERVRRRAA
jgi:hypothetical protein